MYFLLYLNDHQHAITVSAMAAFAFENASITPLTMLCTISANLGMLA